jgi:hypothetical protein
MIYIVAYALFALGPRRWPVLLIAFALAGVLGPTRALGDPGASLVPGLLWSLVSPTVAFSYAAAWAAASVIASRLPHPPQTPLDQHSTA